MIDLALGSLLEAVADADGDRLAQACGARTTTWDQFDDRAARLATFLADRGVGHDAKVAQYLYNGPEYLESLFATMKCRGVPVNVNYRYLADELAYLLDYSDTEVVFFSGALGQRIAEIRDRLPRVRAFIQVDDGAPLLDGAVEYESVIASNSPAPRIERSSDDIIMLFTGGTTGMPKGVMYRCGEAYGPGIAGLAAAAGKAMPTTRAEITDLVRFARAAGVSGVHLPAAPLMHGTGLTSAIGTLLLGGAVVTMAHRSFDPAALWSAVEEHGVTGVSIVGDAFARPLADALDAGTWDLSSVRQIDSAGTMFSHGVKQRLLHHLDITIVDNLSSSEAPGMGSAKTTRAGASATAKFTIGSHTAVFDDDDIAIEPGSGAIGRLAVSGLVPVGYYKDPEKSAATFLEIDGKRWSVPGDYATIEADGSITLLGRGSACINTGGEKVFPEEVEEIVKETPGVLDCLVVGLADERFGQTVAAVVSGDVDPDDVRDFVRSRLAAYKMPRRIVVCDTVERAVNGKPDYAWARGKLESASAS